MSYDSENAEMVAIPIKEFIAAGTVPVDLFVRLSDSKYVLIAKQDSKSSISQLSGLEAKAVHHLYVRREDYNRYVGSNVIIAGIVLSQKELATAKKAEFLARASMSVMKELDVLGMSYEAYEHAKLVALATTTLVESKDDLFHMLQSLGKMSDHMLAHSVGVSAISVMIAKEMGWTKPATFEKLALGGLLHDIGLKELPPDLINKPRAHMTFEEQQAYETHAFRGMEILRTLPSVPDDVVAIAFEHHENAIGQGYPRKMRDLRMNPLAKVVALADAFAELTIKVGGASAPKTALEAVSHIEVTMGQPFNREAFTALRLAIRNERQGAA